VDTILQKLFIISLDSSMCGLLGGVFLSHFSYVSGGGKLGVILGLFVLLIVFQSCLDALVCLIASNVDGPDLLL